MMREASNNMQQLFARGIATIDRAETEAQTYKKIAAAPEDYFAVQG
jgi:hypothetical protein